MYYLIQRLGSNNRPLISIGKNNQKLFTNRVLAKEFIKDVLTENGYTDHHYLLVFDDRTGDLIQKHEGWGTKQIDWVSVV